MPAKNLHHRGLQLVWYLAKGAIKAVSLPVSLPISLPVPSRWRKSRTSPGAAALGLHLLGVLMAGGCGPLVERAPFSYRPDTMAPGDLLGPFEGLVVDAETDRPIAGAVVAGYWAFERGTGLNGPSGSFEVATETGADGRYRIASLDSLPSGASQRIRRFTLIVYQKGYIGWRSDRRFPERTARRDFSQRSNRVRLEKWREGLLHHEHVLFLGGGTTVKSALLPEMQTGALELDGHRAPARPGDSAAAAGAPALLDATALLSEDEVRGVTGYVGEFDVGRLTDLPRTEFYDSRHFKARGRAESYDVGLRVWRLPTAGAEQQFRKLLGELPGAVPGTEVGDASLRARSGQILGMAFLLRERGVVVSLSCGMGQCPEPSLVLRLTKLVESHVPELQPAPSGSPVPEPKIPPPAGPSRQPPTGPGQ
jgi:hypothetical protein